MIETQLEIVNMIPVTYCEYHGNLQTMHNFFLCYRKQTDRENAKKLFTSLENVVTLVGTPVVYWDEVCAYATDSFETGRLKSIENCEVAILLLSEISLKPIEQANILADEVFLEYEFIIEQFLSKKCLLLPIQLGYYTAEGLFKKFRPAPISVYPNEMHCHPKSPQKRTIRETMTELFRIQHIRTLSDKEYTQQIIDFYNTNVLNA
eukprot:c20987_g1_i1.p1 GENE.c20987_g1_i1~~c20987_g1_i1.p1  ORF type:complete len:206 (+),score=52.32 c20987_g1_i1:359-976(+)